MWFNFVVFAYLLFTAWARDVARDEAHVRRYRDVFASKADATALYSPSHSRRKRWLFNESINEFFTPTSLAEECNEAGCTGEEIKESGYSISGVKDYLVGLRCDTMSCKQCYCSGGCETDSNLMKKNQHQIDVACVAVDGGWSEWSVWGDDCFGECGDGEKFRTRLCNNPAPVHGGQQCHGPDKDVTTCKLAPCPAVDGGWSEWSTWGEECVGECGQGENFRARTCNNPPPANGGMPCLGNDTETSPCQLLPCPVDGSWSSWSEWGDCDAICNGGVQWRVRECNNPPPLHGGATCDGQPLESQECALETCSDVWETTYVAMIYTLSDKIDVDCPVVYKEMRNMHEEKADPVDNSLDMSKEECVQRCSDDPVCRAADYNNKTKPWKNTRCWLHKMKNEVKNQTGVEFNIRAPCVLEPGCKDSFVSLADRHMEGGIDFAADSKMECAEKCLSYNSDEKYCPSFDWVVKDTDKKRCWLQLDEIELVSKADLHHYVKETCTSQ